MRPGCLYACAALAISAKLCGQVSLNGGYTQNFNTVSAGLPAGWSVYTSSTLSSLGTPASFTPAATTWSAATAGTEFRNISSNNLATSASSDAQNTNLNRAVGWRPLGSSASAVAPARTGSIGIAFSNTTGLAVTALNLTLFTANDVSGTQTYQFEYRVGSSGDFTQIGTTYSTGAPFNPVTLSANNSTLAALSNRSNTIYLRVRGTATTGASNLDTLGLDDFTIVTAPLPSITTQPASQISTVGDSVNFGVVASGTGPLTYQWRRNGAAITGNTSATTATLTLPDITTAQSGDYDVIVTDSVSSVPSSVATLTVNKATATVTLGSLSTVYNGAPHAATATSNPAGKTVTFTYDGSSTAPTNAGSYTVVGTINDSDYEGSASGTLVIAKAGATISLGSLSTIFNGAAQPATAITTPAGLAVTFSYDGSSTAPTNAGNYAVVGTVSDPNYQGSATGTLTIAKAVASLSLDSLARTYTGTPLSATAVTTPPGLTVNVTYDGSTAPPTNAGSYAVVATLNHANYQGSAAGTLTIAKANALISLGALSAIYDGAPHGTTVATIPPGLSTSLTYAGAAALPTTAGSYAVVATVVDPNYQGSASDTFVIAKASAQILLGGLSAAYDGSTHAATATTTPANLAVRFTYNGSSAPPANAGSYAVIGTIDEPNYQGAASGTLVIAPALASVSLGSLSAIYTGAAVHATASTTPSGLSVSFTYNGSATPPINAGSYAVVGTINDPNYHGSASGTLNVAKALAPLALSALTATYDGTPRPVIATTTPAGLTVSMTYNGSAAAPTDAGSYPVVATITDANHQGSASGTLTITPAAQTIVFAGPGDRLSSAPPFSISATANSGLPVSVIVVSGPATISGNTVSLTGATGTVLLRASQGGGPNHLPASDVERSFDVTAAPVAPNIVTGPATQSATVGDTVTFSFVATGTAPLTYQWKKDGSTLNGATNSSLVLNGIASASAGNYSVVVTNSVGNATSAAGTLTVNKAAQTIQFATLPDRPASAAPFSLVATATSGLPVNFSVVAGPASISGNILTLSGETGAVIVRASQPGNADYLPAPDLEHTFQVTAAWRAPVFLTQPEFFTTGHVGLPATLSAVVDGLPAPALQWRKDGAVVPGATQATLTFTPAALSDTGNYQLVATNAAGTASSALAVLAVTKRPQIISFDAPAAGIPAGASVPLTAVSNSGLPVTLAFVSGAGSLSGNLLTGSGGDIVIRATQPGDAAFAPATLERTFVFVVGGASPFITAAPADQTVNAGADVVFQASAIGTPAPAFHWKKDGVAIAGATSGTLRLPAVTLLDAARYTVVATNLGGSSEASALLVVRQAPRILTSPADQTILAGGAASFSVTTSGFPAPLYQWRRNGILLPGATNSTLSFAQTRASDAGRYDVVATNALGTVISAAASLTIVTRDFTGTYFGRFAGAAGDFALHVRPDGTAVFLGYLPSLQTGLVALDLPIALNGQFSVSVSTLAFSQEASVSVADRGAPVSSAAPQSVTLRGTLDEGTGAVSGAVPELSLSLDGTRIARPGPAHPHAGFYQAALLGSATGRAYAVVAPDGQAYLFSVTGTALDRATGAIGDNGRLVTTSANQSTLDVAFENGMVSGTVRNAGGASATLSGAAEGLAGAEHLMNLSVRATTGSGTANLITGFVVSGTAPKQVLIRAAGPALGLAPFNLTGTLADPTIQIVRGSATLAQNDDWGTPAASGSAISAAASRVGAFPFRTGSNDAALLTTLPPGAYSVVVGGGNGATLAEIYEVLEPNEAPGARRLVNLSARGLVTPAAPFIAGFVIAGAAPQRVLLRGIGPALAAAPFNLSGTLANPQLTLYRGSGPLKTNDDWFRDPDAALIRDTATRVGAFSLGAQSADAAMLLFLEPGAYTVQIAGPANANAANSTGIALVEIYEATP